MGRRPRPHAKAVLRGHTAPVTALRFQKSADTPHILYSGDENGAIRMWDCRYEETVLLQSAPFGLEQSAVLAIIQHECDVDKLLVQHKCGVVTRVDIEYGVRLSEFDAWRVKDMQRVKGDVSFDGYEKGAVLSNGFCAICYVGKAVWVGACADGDQVAVVRDDREKVTLQKRLKVGRGMRRVGMVMSVCKCGQDVVAAYEDGSLATWDLRRCERPRNSTKIAGDAITSVTSSPFGRVAAAIGAFDKVVAVADLTQTTTGIVERVQLKGGGGSEITWRPDGHTLATGGWDGVHSGTVCKTAQASHARPARIYWAALRGGQERAGEPESRMSGRASLAPRAPKRGARARPSGARVEARQARGARRRARQRAGERGGKQERTQSEQRKRRHTRHLSRAAARRRERRRRAVRAHEQRSRSVGARGAWPRGVYTRARFFGRAAGGNGRAPRHVPQAARRLARSKRAAAAAGSSARRGAATAACAWRRRARAARTTWACAGGCSRSSCRTGRPG
ncbi:WD40/YVTN repeat-like containing protein [Gracilaria domingensis]|nr:WD40/YVTN repeat-like containing protein [Gracilaria domingensis]